MIYARTIRSTTSFERYCKDDICRECHRAAYPTNRKNERRCASVFHATDYRQRSKCARSQVLLRATALAIFRQGTGDQGLARSRRPEETGMMAPGRHDLHRPLNVLLSLDRGKNAALLVKLWRFFECFPLLRVMTENHQPDMLPLDQIKQFNRTGADRLGVRVAPVILRVTGKAVGEGYSVNRQ